LNLQVEKILGTLQTEKMTIKTEIMRS
jgi:hypothetical protein